MVKIDLKKAKPAEVNREKFLDMWWDSKKGMMRPGAPILININGHYYDLLKLSFIYPHFSKRYMECKYPKNEMA